MKLKILCPLLLISFDFINYTLDVWKTNLYNSFFSVTPEGVVGLTWRKYYLVILKVGINY